ncbi:hypothetical protein CYMTET_22635 [Cymbomonas tetramitiformis]|uniref:Peptidase C14 caspase domain-containing protein n=1 Tax=Cymbomonas tetramitiformis TaxID=36881 RepID=A0AAE0G026_9CHLO|nr:hypothetical protein CYMTET_22635 [Cymbomonas tetramitiformis]
MNVVQCPRCSAQVAPPPGAPQFSCSYCGSLMSAPPVRHPGLYPAPGSYPAGPTGYGPGPNLYATPSLPLQMPLYPPPPTFVPPIQQPLYPPPHGPLPSFASPYPTPSYPAPAQAPPLFGGKPQGSLFSSTAPPSYPSPLGPPPAYAPAVASTPQAGWWAPQCKKKAVLIGINYTQTPEARLKGCVNDAKCMKYLLTTKFSFLESNIVLLTDETKDQDPSLLPTKQNILAAMRWLVADGQAGDSLFFHFSGHGSQQRDTSGDEADGYDETLVPCDYDMSGQIVDDKINDLLIAPLPAGVRLHAVIDACHSGTAMDLQFTCRMDQGGATWEDERCKGGRHSRHQSFSSTQGGDAVLFSGCQDNQTSADTNAMSGNVSTGAMTYCFIEAIEKTPSHTYSSLLMGMRQALKAGKQKFSQIPQLSSAQAFDMNRAFMI